MCESIIINFPISSYKHYQVDNHEPNPKTCPKPSLELGYGWDEEYWAKQQKSKSMCYFISIVSKKIFDSFYDQTKCSIRSNRTVKHQFVFCRVTFLC